MTTSDARKRNAEAKYTPGGRLVGTWGGVPFVTAATDPDPDEALAEAIHEAEVEWISAELGTEVLHWADASEDSRNVGLAGARAAREHIEDENHAVYCEEIAKMLARAERAEGWVPGLRAEINSLTEQRDEAIREAADYRYRVITAVPPATDADGNALVTVRLADLRSARTIARHTINPDVDARLRRAIDDAIAHARTHEKEARND